MRLLRKIQESIFLKLLLTFAVAGTTNIGVMHVFQRHILSNSSSHVHRRQNMAQYAHFLVATLGTNPTAAQIQELSETLHIQVRVETPTQTLVSSPQVPDFSKIRSYLDVRYSNEDSQVGKYQDYLAMTVSRPQAHYLFLLESIDNTEDHSRLLISVMTALLLILFFTYLFICHILSPLRDLEKGVHEVSCGNLDFTVENKSRDELGRLVQSFNHMTRQISNLIQSKEQLLLNVSHELRSPLTRIKVAMELPGKAPYESIQRAIRELETMIHEILESARINTPQGRLLYTNVNLNRLLCDLVSKYEKDKPGIQLKLPADPIFIEADLFRLRTVFQNLFENAIKYSNHQTQPIQVTLSYLTTRIIRISIQDFGVGVAPEQQLLIFEPFYRTDPSRAKSTGGYGLGLSICKKIITAHKGVIQIQSSSEPGTLFTVDLPCFS